MTARRCQCCERTAMLGTPAAADAIDPHNCPRCDHFYMHALAGGTSSFRGVDSPIFAAPSPAPAPLPDDGRFDTRAPIRSAELTEVPVAWLPCEAGYEPEAPTSLDGLITMATFLTLARWGVTAHVGTGDGRLWQCVCRDPETGATLDDHPSETRGTPEEAVQGMIDLLHELNVADAVAADERAAEVLAHRVAHPELEAPEPSPLPGDDGRFDARPRSLADAYPGLPFAFTVTPDGEVLDTATGAPLGPEAAAEVDDDDVRRAEVA